MPILPLLTLFFTLTITFCKKTLHFFFDFAHYNFIHFSPNCSAGALSFVIFSAARNHQPIKAAESMDAMKPPPQPPSSPTTTTSASSLPASKRDQGGIGFVHEVGGKVDGWMSCTESLGFESSDEWVGEKDIENWINHRHQCGVKAKATATPRKRKSLSSSSAKAMKSFPPPLSSLDCNGYPTFFLRPVRKDGRLELTAVKIDRPHVLLASRQDGRLRLRLVLSRDVGAEDYRVDDEAVEEDKQNIHQQEAEAAVEEYEKQKEKDSEWRFPSGGVDGFRRCHELASHHKLHGWSQPCVTIR